MDTLKLLRNVLHSSVSVRKTEFSGLGVLVHSSVANLPIIAMREKCADLEAYSASELLAKISTPSSRYHDGFHLLSLDCKLTHLSQYFSPPIDTSIQLPNTDSFGGRYVAALFGSTISGVEFTAVVSTNLELSIFRNGKCVSSERLA